MYSHERGIYSRPATFCFMLCCRSRSLAEPQQGATHNTHEGVHCTSWGPQPRHSTNRNGVAARNIHSQHGRVSGPIFWPHKYSRPVNSQKPELFPASPPHPPNPIKGVLKIGQQAAFPPQQVAALISHVGSKATVTDPIKSLPLCCSNQAVACSENSTIKKTTQTPRKQHKAHL